MTPVQYEFSTPRHSALNTSSDLGWALVAVDTAGAVTTGHMVRREEAFVFSAMGLYSPPFQVSESRLTGMIGSRLRTLIGTFIAILPFLQSTCSGHVILKASSGHRSGAVSSESKTCSEIGIELLKMGVS